MKRTRPKVGDVIQITLPNGRYSYGRVLRRPRWVLPRDHRRTWPTPDRQPGLSVRGRRRVKVDCLPRQRALGQSVGRSGALGPAQITAHHIVPGGAPQAAAARAALSRFEIGINDAQNGVFLPRNLGSANPSGVAVHSTLHTSRYFSSINELLGQAGSRAEALDALSYIRDQLLRGLLP